MPSGPGVIRDPIAEIARNPPPSHRFCSPVSPMPERSSRTPALQDQHDQICDRITRGTHVELRSRCPARGSFRLHIRDEYSVEEAAAVAPFVNAILLDSGNQSLAVKELGGTGRCHDWSISRQIRETVGVPIFLAGGLTANISARPSIWSGRSESMRAAACGQTALDKRN